MLSEFDVKVQPKEPSAEDFYLSIAVDRTSRSPCVTVSSSAEKSPEASLKIPFDYANPAFAMSANNTTQLQILSFLGYEADNQEAVGAYIRKLYTIFKSKEAFVLETRVTFSAEKEIVVHDAKFGFDDAAYKSAGRHEELHKLRDVRAEVPEEVEAEKSGIVYVK